MLKLIVFDPAEPLESMIACRSDPGPLSPVLTTENVAINHRCSRFWKVKVTL
jgi:hypothetical protein